MHRILDLKPIGRETDVLVTYFDDQTLDTYEIIKNQQHIIPSIELLTEKYSPEKVLEDLTQKYPDIDFELKPYGYKKDSFVIWSKGNRKNKTSLEHFVKKGKQIFITNQEFRFKPKSIQMQTETLLQEIKNLETISGIKEIIVKENSLELKTNKRAIRNLPSSKFKILEYESHTLTKEEAEIKKQRIAKEIPEFIDGLKIINAYDGSDGYKVTVRTINRPDIQKRFKNFILKDTTAREIKYDPLNLNSPKKQLIDLHPLYTPFDTNLPLEDQIIRKLNPHKKNLEELIENISTYFKKNTAVIDLEVADYTSEKISGQIFMAVLKSDFENKIYLTSKAYNPQIKKQLKYLDVDLVFLRTEKDLIKKLNEDANKYEFIMGYNIDDFDLLHLTKFKDEKIWSYPKDNVLDALPYVKNRISLLKNRKLETISNFKKTISYEEMNDLLAKKDLPSIKKIVDYTIEDGNKTFEVLTDIIKFGVIESIATNKSLPKIFRNKPSKNFYDAGQRNYFIKLNTYRDRHEFSPIKFYQKFEDRKTNEELLSDILTQKKDKKLISGDLYYPSLFIDATQEILSKKPIVNFALNELKQTEDPFKKLLLISTISGAITVPIDKLKNYMEDLNLKFASFQSEKELLNKSQEIQELSNQTSFIFAKTYNISNFIWRQNNSELDITMLNINNSIAFNLENLTYDHSIGHLLVNANSGIKLGKIKAVKIGENKLIGKLNDLDISFGMNYPKHPYLKDLIEDFLETDNFNINKWYTKIPSDLNQNQMNFVKAVLQVNPSKRKGNQGYLF